MARSHRIIATAVAHLSIVAALMVSNVAPALSEEDKPMDSVADADHGPLMLRPTGPAQDWLRLVMPDQTLMPAGFGDPPPGTQSLRIRPNTFSSWVQPGWSESVLDITSTTPVHWGYNRFAISDRGYMYLGVGGNSPHTGEPFLFSVYGDGPMNDIAFTGTGPRRIFRNWALPAMNQMNLWSGHHGGAYVQLYSDQPGEIDSGRILIRAAASGNGPRANSVRFLTRSGPNAVAERMVVAPNGYVGIGTAQPRRLLDVRGDVKIGSPESPARLQMFDPASWAPWTISVRDGNVVVERLVAEAGNDGRTGAMTSGGKNWLVPMLALFGVALASAGVAYWKGSAVGAPVAAGLMLATTILGWPQSGVGDTADATPKDAPSLSADSVGDPWMELHTPDNQSFKLMYYRGHETRENFTTPDLPPQTALVIAPGNPKPGAQHVLLLDGGFVYVGFDNELFRGGYPHGWRFAAPFAFGFNGDMLVGDIGLIGNSPHQIGSRDFARDMAKAAPTAYFSNRNFPGTDEHSGAGFTMWSVEGGEVDSGQVELIAYGRGDAPQANSIRFRTRSGPGELADRMIIAGDGRVGIGTTTPEAALDIAGDMQVGSYERYAGIILHDTVDGKAYRINAGPQWTATKGSALAIEPVDVAPGTDEIATTRDTPLIGPPDPTDLAPSDLSHRLAANETAPAVSRRVSKVGEDWVRFETNEGDTYAFRYHRSVEPRSEYRSTGLEAVPALAIVPPVEGPQTRMPIISENGRMYLGFANEIVAPHSGIPYAFAADGPILIGDIMINGKGPRRIGYRHVPLTKATPTYLQSNLNAAGNDEGGGASLGLWSDGPGADESGQLRLDAYGQGTGPRANSIRLYTNTNAERLCVDSKGRVGIGTDTPANPLEVRGDVIIGSADHPSGIIVHDDADGTPWRLQVTQGAIQLVRVER